MTFDRGAVTVEASSTAAAILAARTLLLRELALGPFGRVEFLGIREAD